MYIIYVYVYVYNMYVYDILGALKLTYTYLLTWISTGVLYN